MTPVIVVLANTEEGIPAATARLGALGVTASEVVAPSETRRLLLALVADDTEAARIVARLRADDQPAVLRPVDGARLEIWTDHTRPV
jgi:hypothetical protein